MGIQRFADAPVPSQSETPWSFADGAVGASGDFQPLDASVFPGAGPFDILIEDEWVIVGTVTAGVWSGLTRGAYGSTAVTHADGTGIYHVLTAAALSRIPRSLTTAGDFEYMGASGAPVRLGQPGDGVWAVSFSGGVPSWGAIPAASGLTTANFASPNISQWTNNAGYLTSVTNISGNAGTATALQTPRAINGVNFDGTANITITAAAALTVGTTTISSGTSGRVLYDNAGVVGEATVTGTLGSVVLSDSPSLTTVGTLTRTAVGSTSADGWVLTNTTAAAAGAQQYSPRLRFTGAGWKTNATAASQIVDWIVENQPVQGAASPSTRLVLSSQVNGGGYSPQFQFGSDGKFYIYNTWTDASNGEWGAIRWSSNVLNIGAEANGTGTVRRIRLNAAGATGVVGINMTPTSTPLDIAVDGGGNGFKIFGTAGDFLFQSGGVYGASLISTNNSSTTGFVIGTDGGSTVAGSVLAIRTRGTNRLTINDVGLMTLFDGGNFATGTTTGTKWGTAASQKQAWWGATPIVQPTTAIAAATRVGGGGTALTDTDTFDGYTIAQIVKVIRTIGQAA